MDKKGQEITFNVVIVAILVIIVLVLVVTFFFGGFTALTEKIRGIFYVSEAGTGETLALQACDRYCSNLELRSYADEANLLDVAKTSSFCQPRKVDLNGDGEITEDEQAVDCKDLRVSCEIATATGKKVSVTC